MFSVPRLNFPQWDQTAHLDRYRPWKVNLLIGLSLSHELAIHRFTVAPILRTLQISPQTSVNVSKIRTTMPTKSSCVYFVFVTIALLANAPVEGRCPDHCSGHGTCVIQNHKHSTRNYKIYKYE